MPASSTAASRLALPARALVPALLVAVAVAAGFGAWLEWRLASRGVVPTAIDTPELWLQERERASELGARAIVVVGASRAQLDVDLDVLRQATGLEPVQLAIDGSGMLPILEGLARDPTITGTVIVDIVDAALATPRTDTADEYQALYERHEPRAPLTYRWSEEHLARTQRLHMRSYADGARPVTSFLLRAIGERDTVQYLVTRPDRSRLADYRLVQMPGFYLARVARNAGLGAPPKGRDAAEVERLLAAHIATMRPLDNAHYLRNVERIRAAIAAIEARGGRVRLVVFPTSGLVRAIDHRATPRERFWDHMAAMAGERALRSEDRPALAGFDCPDGSHLDRRDRARFTAALAGELRLEKR